MFSVIRLAFAFSAREAASQGAVSELCQASLFKNQLVLFAVGSC